MSGFVETLGEVSDEYLKIPGAGRRAVLLTALSEYLDELLARDGYCAEWRLVKALEQAWLSAEHECCLHDCPRWIPAKGMLSEDESFGPAGVDSMSQPVFPWGRPASQSRAE